MLAGEILSFHLNARTADDDLALTDANTRHVEVEVGQIFHLEIAYEDLREPAAENPRDFGAFAVGVDVLASLPEAIVPVLTETQRILVSPSVTSATEGTIDVALLGTNRTSQITLDAFADSPNLAIKDAAVALGYDAENIDVSFRSNAEGFILIELQYVGTAFAGIDLPDISLEFDVTDAAGDPVSVDAEVQDLPPILADGSINGAALSWNYDTRSRTFGDNESFYDAINRGTYDPALGFNEVNGVGQLIHLGEDVGVNPSEPFDVLSIPVYVNRKVSDLELSLNPAERFDSNLAFGLDEALRDDQLEFDPAASSITISSKGSFDDSPLRNFYFTASTQSSGEGLYLSDGSTTRLIRSRRGTPSIEPESLKFIADRLFFTSKTRSGERELYVTDGSEAGTRIVTNISDETSTDPEELTDAGDRVYFTALKQDGQRELYFAEGDFSRARPLIDLSGDLSSDPQELTMVGDTLFFSALNSKGERELYRSDGTSRGTRPVANLSGTVSSEPMQITSLGELAVFSALNSDGVTRSLYVSDGSAEGTQPIADAGIDPRSIVTFGEEIFYSAVSAAGVRSLYRSDGITAEAFASEVATDPAELTLFDSRIFFVADGADGQRELFRSDGTVGGTSIVRDIAGIVSSQPQDLTVINQRLAFTALLPDGNRELFRSRGTAETTNLVNNLHGDHSSEPELLTAVGNRLAFVATSPEGSRDLYFSNLSRNGTVPVEQALNGDFDDVQEIVEANISTFQIFQNGTGSLRPTSVLPLDANSDGRISSLDALRIVNFLGQSSSGESESLGRILDDLEHEPLDVNRDGSVTARDALAIINFLATATVDEAFAIEDEDEFVEGSLDPPETSSALF